MTSLPFNVTLLPSAITTNGPIVLLVDKGV